MKFLLVLLLVLIVLGTLCDAGCYMRPPNKYGCIENGKRYKFGVVWNTDDCYKCKCKRRAMTCCNVVFTPQNYDKVNCVALFHKRTCTIRVVRKKNPDIPCKIYNGVG
ncbi:beta-microseminoprotein-like [Alligator mississippiensis]|uniref:Beta-microseminoprotein-like n=1 Tax=Alligator mississippiensis TaxID=8496 RepID=A0A151MKV2_ALLMI|nr:beta-microseminoprotein-like [Alligator mississippiensis]